VVSIRERTWTNVADARRPKIVDHSDPADNRHFKVCTKTDAEASLIIPRITVAVATKVRDKSEPAAGLNVAGRARVFFDISPET
jgi:hypothetical protein